MEKAASSCSDQRDFLLRRLHSLSGLVPVGAYMVIHLATNSTVWKAIGGPGTFQRAVYGIHSLGPVLPIVEWVFIFLPLLFHAIFGVMIIQGALPNHSSYRTGSNFRYSLQRATGMIALIFIFYHVFHMHGWFHFDPWLKNVAEPLGGHKFRPYNAGSSLGSAMSGDSGSTALFFALIYFVGVLSCVFHLANGIWTAGITWGVWVSPQAQDRALKACTGFGVLLAIVGLSALWGATHVDANAKQVEDQMYNAKVQSGEIDEQSAEHKRTKPAAKADSEANAKADGKADETPADSKAADQPADEKAN